MKFLIFCFVACFSCSPVKKGKFNNDDDLVDLVSPFVNANDLGSYATVSKFHDERLTPIAVMRKEINAEFGDYIRTAKLDDLKKLLQENQDYNFNEVINKRYGSSLYERRGQSRILLHSHVNTDASRY